MAGGAMLLNNIPIQALARQGVLQQLAATSSNDNVLVIIQLHGGNDGLNTIIPIDQYAQYLNMRPNIAIPDHGGRRFIDLDNTLASAYQVGLHPDMSGLKTLYDQGRVNIIQSVGYQNINQSHFRSRDIWFMGGDYDETLDSGWMGRYLENIYPNYPDAYPSQEMPDPLGLEIGSSVSLAFHRSNGIPTGIAVDNPEQFYNLINSVGGEPPAEVANTYYGHELQWILDIEKKSDQYAGRLKDVYEKGRNSSEVSYPEKYPFNAPAKAVKNGIGAQLRMIARLLSGGSKTRIFLARIGGFDTHAAQVESYDATMGTHASLLYHLSSSLRAFQDDLKSLGLEDKVLTMTMSEFGRRPASNGSWGTDHGTAAPMIVVGKHVNPGVIGKNPDLANLDHHNLSVQHDYRQVFGAIVQDWFQGDAQILEETRFSDYVKGENKIPLIRDYTLGSPADQFVSDRFALYDCVPNPAHGLVQFSYKINAYLKVDLSVYDLQGRHIQTIVQDDQHPGSHQQTLDVSSWKKGTYICILKAGSFRDQKKLIVV